MVSRAKLYAQLEALELDLEGELMPHLKKAADGDNDLVFSAHGYSSFTKTNGRSDKITESLIAIGAQIISLKLKLGESSENSIAERICWYCNEWGGFDSRHQKSAKALAQQFLQEIEDRKTETSSASGPSVRDK
jgi:hypothetical protein